MRSLACFLLVRVCLIRSSFLQAPFIHAQPSPSIPVTHRQATTARDNGGLPGTPSLFPRVRPPSAPQRTTPPLRGLDRFLPEGSWTALLGAGERAAVTSGSILLVSICAGRVPWAISHRRTLVALASRSRPVGSAIGHDVCWPSKIRSRVTNTL